MGMYFQLLLKPFKMTEEKKILPPSFLPAVIQYKKKMAIRSEDAGGSL